MSQTPDMALPRVAPRARLDWRILVAVAASIILLAAYFMPMFTHRIVSARTQFSGGTTIQSYFPVLISGQHYKQAHHPLNEELLPGPEGVSIRVAPVEPAASTGWGWLAYIISHTEYVGSFVSYLFCLLLPIFSTALILLLMARAYFSQDGWPESLIPLTINLAILAPISLLLAWLHQFDFSFRLYGLASAALAPRFGFWLAIAGSVAIIAAVQDLRTETHKKILSWWALVFIVAMGVWMLTRFKPQPFLEIWNFVSDGILVTLRIVLTSFGLILLVSLLGGLGRISRSPIIYGISSLYVEIVRGIPLLVQLLFIWFALPQVFDIVGGIALGISGTVAERGWLEASNWFAQQSKWWIDLRLQEYTAAVLGLTVCYGAYGSEIFRAGISSIHRGQMEAARSLGMSYLQGMRYIILPQAVRVILPPIGNEFVALLKDSSLVSVLAVSDLTRRGREYMSRTFLSFDTWIMVALCYLVLTLFSSRAVEFIESKTRFER